MKTLIKLFSLWRPPLFGLIIGLLLSELSLITLLLLMGQTGNRLSYAILGTNLFGFLILRISGIGRIILRYFERLQTHHAMFCALKTLRLWFYKTLLRHGARGLGFRRSADMLTRLVHDIQTLDNLYLRIFIPFALACLSFPILIILLHQVTLFTSFIICALFAITAFILPFISYKISRHYSTLLLKARAALHVHALDLTLSLREARIFNAEKIMQEKLLKAEETLYKYQKEKGKKTALIHLVALTLSRLAVIIFLFSTTALFTTYHPQNKTIITIATTTITIFFVLTSLFDVVSDLPRAGLLVGESVEAAERIIELHHESAITPENMPKSKNFPQKFDISLQNISFGWNEEKPLFQNLSLFIPQGSKLALIGPSGAGKSSLVGLILRSLTPQKGEIFIHQTPISHIKEEELRKNIAWLSQTSHLFDDTIGNNLLLGRKDISEEKLWNALEKAQIADFVRELPNGLNQWAGENGTQLSGGQGRRIALARALLSEAPILILDEPATGLDFDTECAFLKTLNNIDKGMEQKKTIILITHRLLGIEEIDYVWQIEKGKIEQKMMS